MVFWEIPVTFMYGDPRGVLGDPRGGFLYPGLRVLLGNSLWPHFPVSKFAGPPGEIPMAHFPVSRFVGLVGPPGEVPVATIPVVFDPGIPLGGSPWRPCLSSCTLACEFPGFPSGFISVFVSPSVYFSLYCSLPWWMS